MHPGLDLSEAVWHVSDGVRSVGKFDAIPEGSVEMSERVITFMREPLHILHILSGPHVARQMCSAPFEGRHVDTRSYNSER